ncbi:MAG TPA: hypothetical protein VLO30_08965, partial [Chthoniobacterales bacterium]|nr:hypothetical protein [Chthoniobacterales bacterium]
MKRSTLQRKRNNGTPAHVPERRFTNRRNLPGSAACHPVHLGSLPRWTTKNISVLPNGVANLPTAAGWQPALPREITGDCKSPLLEASIAF